MARTLVVEDDPATGAVLSDHLRKAGHVVAWVTDGAVALSTLEQSWPELIVVDWMLPNVSGPQICRAVRAHITRQQPIIVMLTARSDELDVLEGFAAGIDDYVRKPFGVRELRCRFDALLRLARRGAASVDAWQFGDLHIDSEVRLATVKGSALDLTPKEFDLLAYFARAPHVVHRREELLQRVWGYDHSGYARTVDSHVTRLRRKLAGLGWNHECIVTVHRLGYRFQPPDAA